MKAVVELCAEGVGHMDKGLQGCTDRKQVTGKALEKV